MNKNQGRNMAIIAVCGFIAQLIFKWMGDSNKATIIQGIIIIFLCIILAIYFLKNTTKKRLGNKLSIIGAILVLIVGIVISVIHISSQYYPEFHKEHKELIIRLMIGSFSTLAIYFMVVAGIVSDRDHMR